MEMISAGGMAEADGYIGYMKPCATSHQDFDDDKAFQEQARNVARAPRRCHRSCSNRSVREPRKRPQGAATKIGRIFARNVILDRSRVVGERLTSVGGAIFTIPVEHMPSFCDPSHRRFDALPGRRR